MFSEFTLKLIILCILLAVISFSSSLLVVLRGLLCHIHYVWCTTAPVWTAIKHEVGELISPRITYFSLLPRQMFNSGFVQSFSTNTNNKRATQSLALFYLNRFVSLENYLYILVHETLPALYRKLLVCLNLKLILI